MVNLVSKLKLAILGAASSIEDLRELRGNSLEAIKGTRPSQFSVRINQQYRICVDWRKNNAFNVEIVDYHYGKIMSYVTPTYPGLVLQDELEEIGISQTGLAEHIGVLPKTINEICNGKMGISAAMAWKFSNAIGASPPILDEFAV